MRTTLLPLPVAFLALAACNEAPDAPQIVLNPGEPTTTDDIAVMFLTLTADGNAKDEVTHTYQWFQDGTFRADLTTDTVPASETTKGETWKVIVVPNDGKLDGEPAEASATVVNTPPVATVSIAADPLTDVDLVAEVASEDADADTVSYTYAWTRDGEAIQATNGTIPASETAHGETWTVTVTPNDGEEDGEPVTASVVVANSAPTVESVELSPSPAYEDTVLTATAFGVDDLDDDGVTLTYTWYVNDTEVQSGEDDTLTGALFDKYDLVRVEVTPTDGFVDGATVASDDLLVENTVASGTSVSIVSSSADGAAYEASTLTCTPAGWADADGDPEAWTYAWTVDGVEASTAQTIDGALFDKNDVVACTATPTDGEGSGATLTSIAISVSNTVPVLSSATLSTSAPTESDTVSVTLGAATDVDGDTVTYAYAWSVDGTLVSTSATLLPSRFVKGDVIEVTVVPNDGEADGAPVTASVVVANSAPSVERVELSPTPAYEDTVLTATVFGVDDLDDDGVALTYTWYVNDTEVQSGEDDTLTGALFDKHDLVRVEVTPNDGYVDGAVVGSDDLLIENTVASGTSVSIISSSADGAAYEASTLTCTPAGWADADADTEGWTYTWSVDGTSVSTAATIDGTLFSKSDVVACTATPTDGEASGSTLTSSAVAVSNTVPVLASATLSTSAPTESDTVSVALGAASDDDGDTLSYSYAWYVDGALVSTSATLLPSRFAKGDVVEVTVTPYDGTDLGAPVTSASAIAANSAPTVRAVTLSPSAVYTNDTLTVSVSSSDLDGDTASLTYDWTVNGVPVGASGPTLDGEIYFDRDDVVTVTVTPTDGEDTGTSLTSSSVTIRNTAPTAPVVAIDPTDPEAGDSLFCDITTDATDADGDAITYAFAWEQDGAAFGSASTTVWTGDTVAGAYVQDEQEWTCSVTASDGTDSGSPGTDTVTVGAACAAASTPVWTCGDELVSAGTIWNRYDYVSSWYAGGYSVGTADYVGESSSRASACGTESWRLNDGMHEMLVTPQALEAACDGTYDITLVGRINTQFQRGLGLQVSFGSATSMSTPYVAMSRWVWNSAGEAGSDVSTGTPTTTAYSYRLDWWSMASSSEWFDIRLQIDTVADQCTGTFTSATHVRTHSFTCALPEGIAPTIVISSSAPAWDRGGSPDADIIGLYTNPGLSF